jgi:catechol 2,3-dioxygenase-like lactoylglutathione lyase family enzyme
MNQIGGILHVNMNCSNFERSRSFYETVGFRLALEFPEGEYPEVGRGLNVGRHRVRGALFMIGEAHNPTFFDLLEWNGPRNEPGAGVSLTAVGSPRLALWTNAFDAEVDRLRKAGMKFLAEPVEVVGPTGTPSRFVCFPDPDGHILELVELAPSKPETTGALDG